jgi:hypothetical protein
MTFDDLKKLAEGEGLRYFVAPDRPMLLMGIGGLNGNYQIVAPLELDGRFLQFRPLGYASCPASHPNVEAVLRVLGDLNFKLRLTKFGWDPADGEIAAYADVWLEDGTLTQKQFAGILGLYVPGLDLNHPRIATTIESGVDPGEFRPEDILGRASGLPPKLQEALDRIAPKGPEGDEPEGPAVI